MTGMGVRPPPDLFETGAEWLAIAGIFRILHMQ